LLLPLLPVAPAAAAAVLKEKVTLSEVAVIEGVESMETDS
jgi:hypothetical protein